MADESFLEGEELYGFTAQNTQLTISGPFEPPNNQWELPESMGLIPDTKSNREVIRIWLAKTQHFISA